MNSFILALTIISYLGNIIFAGWMAWAFVDFCWRHRHDLIEFVRENKVGVILGLINAICLLLLAL